MGLERRKAPRTCQGLGTPERPRSAVHSHKRQTFMHSLLTTLLEEPLLCLSTLDPEFVLLARLAPNKEAAEFVGELIGARCREERHRGHFDRGGCPHAVFGDGVRNAGLKFCRIQWHVIVSASRIRIFRSMSLYIHRVSKTVKGGRMSLVAR